MDNQKFTKKIRQWIDSDQPKNIQSIDDNFKGKSIVVAILLLMFLPAIPVPTGGVSHVFEIIAFTLAFSLVIGKHEIRIKKSWKQKDISRITGAKLTSKAIGVLSRLENMSRPRLGSVFSKGILVNFLGAVMMLFILLAFIAPPFSGFDTLPAMAVVMICLSIIFGDIAFTVIGLTLGSVGLITLIIIFDRVISHLRSIF
jgi:hypothetical protein